MDEKCCFVERRVVLAHPFGTYQAPCVEPAEFRVVDLDDPRPDVAETFACEGHVGPLLGHAEGWGGRGGTGWQVVPLNPL